MEIASYQSIRKTFVTQSHERFATEVLNALLPIHARALEVTDALAAKVDRNLKDRDRSDEGKRKTNVVTSNEFTPQYAFLGNHRTDVTEAVTRLRTVNFGALDLPKESEIKALIRELRAGELRAAFNGSNREATFLKALEHGNLELAHAFLYAPGGSWVSDEIRQRGAEAFAEHTNPKAYHQLRHILVVQSELDALAEQTRQMLVGLGADAVAVAKALNGGAHAVVH